MSFARGVRRRRRGATAPRQKVRPFSSTAADAGSRETILILERAHVENFHVCSPPGADNCNSPCGLALDVLLIPTQERQMTGHSVLTDAAVPALADGRGTGSSGCIVLKLPRAIFRAERGMSSSDGAAGRKAEERRWTWWTSKRSFHRRAAKHQQAEMLLYLHTQQLAVCYGLTGERPRVPSAGALAGWHRFLERDPRRWCSTGLWFRC